MNIPKYSLENQKIIYFFLAVMLIGGIYSFFKLPKKEDSPFVIKQAVLVTQYPGATPQEVEKLVTEPIEREIQAMSDVFQIKSESYFGMSKISIELQPTLSPDYMPVKWDELRRKVANIQPRLPSGASSISVSDDFGDVFGIYYALTADEGYTYDDLRNWAQKIKTELSPVPGVQKVYLFGEQTQVVNVKISIPKLANLGIDPNAIQQVMQTQNLLVNTGDINTGNYQLRLRAEGTYKDIQDIRDQLIVTKSGGEVRLGDIATVERGYMDPPSNLMRVDGKRAIGIGVATGSKDDVVAVGNAVADHLAEMEQLFPVGMDLKTIYPENKIAEAALMENYKLQMTNDEQPEFTTATPLPEAFTSRRETLRLMPLYELLEELFSIFGMSRIEKQDAYLFSFFDAVTEYLQSNSSELDSFIRYWDETLCSKTIPSGEMDGIRILSIHKSKGL